MRLCDYKTPLTGRLNCPIWAFVGIGGGDHHNVSAGKFFQHGFMRPRDCPAKVGHHPQRVTLNVRQDALEALLVDGVPIPQQIHAVAMRRHLIVFKRVGNDHGIFAQCLDALCHFLSWASHHIGNPQRLGVVRPIKMVIAEIHNDPCATRFGPRHFHQFMRLRLGKHQCACGQVIEACPCACRYFCAVTPACRPNIAKVNERNPIILLRLGIDDAA